MIKDLIKSITKKEWCFLILVTLFVILLTTAPYLYGWYQTPVGYTYTGLHSLTPADMHVYFSWMEQVKQGDFISVDLYTSETQHKVILNGFWSVMGLIALISGLSNITVFHLIRILLIPLFLFVLYLLAAYFWQDKKWRKICFIFLTFASGLGFLISGIIDQSVYRKGWYNWPLDLWAPETNNLLTMLQSGHLILASMFIIIVLFLMFFAFEKNILKYSVSAGIIAAILFQFHPFHVPTIFGVLSIYLLIQFVIHKKVIFSYLKHISIFGLLSSPSIFYWLVLEQNNFVTQIRTYQNVCLTPSLWVIVFSYGLILVLAIFAIIIIFKKNKLNNLNIFLVTWLVVQFTLLYSPVNFQRRMVQGLQFPMILLAVIGLNYIYIILKKRLSLKKFDFWINNKYLAIIIFILLFCSSNIFNLVREFSIFVKKSHPILYISNDKLDSIFWLKENSQPDQAILTDYFTGNLIPGYIGHQVFLGHGVETLFFYSKYEQINWFFSNNIADDKKKLFLKNNNISYILYTSQTRNMGDFQPSQKDYLRQVFYNEQVEIYKVI